MLSFLCLLASSQLNRKILQQWVYKANEKIVHRDAADNAGVVSQKSFEGRPGNIHGYYTGVSVHRHDQRPGGGISFFVSSGSSKGQPGSGQISSFPGFAGWSAVNNHLNYDKQNVQSVGSLLAEIINLPLRLLSSGSNFFRDVPRTTKPSTGHLNHGRQHLFWYGQR